MLIDILLIVGYFVYMGIGVVVAEKEAENGCEDLTDYIVCGIFGAFWPLTLLFKALLEN